jgi:hypothetical protein
LFVFAPSLFVIKCNLMIKKYNLLENKGYLTTTRDHFAPGRERATVLQALFVATGGRFARGKAAPTWAERLPGRAKPALAAGKLRLR